MAADRRLRRQSAAEVADRNRSIELLAAPTTVATVLIVALAARTFTAGRVVSPWIMIDELTYSDLARSFADGGTFALRGHDASVYSVLYPIVISPAWLVHSMDATYAIAKAINVVLVTAAALPLYLWARRLVSPAYALLALLLFLLLPSLLYSGTLMTENAALPAFLLAAFLLALALERPTPARQALLLAAIATCALIRLQGLVLAPIVVTAIAASIFLEDRAGAVGTRARLVRFWPTFLAFALAAAAYAVVSAIRGAPFRLFGAYGVVATADYSVGEAARWTVRHFAELGLAVGVVPVAAFILLAARALREPRSSTPQERAFLAVAVAFLVWFPIQSGVFASHFAQRVQERTMLYVEPLLLLALVLWLARGAARSRILSPLAAAAPVVLLLALPLGTLLAESAVSDTFALVPLLVLREHWGMATVDAVVWGGAAALAATFAAAPRRVARVLVPLGVGAVLAGSSIVVADRIADESRAARAAPHVGEDVDWIDRTIGGGAAAGFLYTASVEPQAGWQTEFWNRSVRRVLRLDAVEPGGLPNAAVSLDRTTGRVEGSESAPRFVVAPKDLVVEGRLLGERGPWRLYRAAVPLRLESSLQGVAQDGWMGAAAVYTVYRGHRDPRTVEIVLSRRNWGGQDVPGRVRVVVGSVGAARRAAVLTGVLHSSEALRYVVPAPRTPFRIRVTVEPTFSPADFGFPDERQLGAIPSFRLLGG